MAFTSSGFSKGIVLALVVGAMALVGLKYFGFFDPKENPDDPRVLARAATAALEAVRGRQPGDRRPPSYDAVMAPLDKLLRQAREVMESENYSPLNDYDKVRALAVPVIDIATQAAVQARTETGPLAKDFRFGDQKGEACQYLANALWERMNARRPRITRPLEEPEHYPQSELDELMRILDSGIEAAPGNRNLWYIRGVVNRAQGLFAPAARDLEHAIAIDSEYPAAWNTLGLVRIALKEFDGAEEALERAKVLALDEARRFNRPPGEEYTSILYNLATFHDNLATYYNRENRVNPTVESRRLLARHSDGARKYWEEFLSREPAGSPDARAAQARLSALPR